MSVIFASMPFSRGVEVSLGHLGKPTLFPVCRANKTFNKLKPIMAQC